MRNWGIGLFITGAIWLYGYIQDPKSEGSSEGLPVALVFVGAGSLLAYKGQNYIDSMREIAEESFKQIREKDYIDASALSKKFQISEIEIREKIIKAQKQKILPFDAVIKWNEYYL